MQTNVVLAAVAGLTLVALAISQAAPESRLEPLLTALALGAAAGLSLYHASFGFTAGWRRWTRERRGAGIRAQLLLLALVILVSYPMIAAGQTGVWVFPVGAATVIGAAMFGFGMQLGGGCGSGTLFTVGGGSTRMLLTLVSFIAGSLLWSGTQEIWRDLPSLAPVSTIRLLGASGALVATLAIFAALGWITLSIEGRRHGSAPVFGVSNGLSLQVLSRGPWPAWLGSVLLAAVVIGCFLWLGRPWGITSVFPLWGASAADAIGLPVREWRAWSGAALDRSLFTDATGVMNFGVMLGALGAAGLAGRFAPTLRLSARDVATAVIGGLLMGYGARLAYGCNIGGLIGGIASGSLHGWSWALFGFLGSVAGVALRARLGMDPPRAR